MPIHDWCALRIGKFHHLHNSWIYKISAALNAGILPDGFYAAGEQVAADLELDVLTKDQTPSALHDWSQQTSAIATASTPPKVTTVVESETARYLRHQDRLAIRAPDDDRLVALIEIVSRGNKASRHEQERFLQKVGAAFRQGIHLLIVDLHPPATFEPRGIHALIWDYLFGSQVDWNAESPLTLVAYEAGTTAYVEPTAVGRTLTDMPLFLDQGWYVNVPLEQTYQEAFDELPQPWKQELVETLGA